MDKYTAQAPTVEEAIEKALKELSATREEVKIDVIEEGKKGFLGFGQKDAIVSVRRKKSQPILNQFITQDELVIDAEDESDDTEKMSDQPSEMEEKTSEKLHSKNENDPLDIENTLNESIQEKNTELQETEREETLLEMSSEEKDEKAIQYAADYIESIAVHMGADPVNVYLKQEGDEVTFTIDTEKAGIVIGRHGRVLNALQSLVQVVLLKEADSKLTAVVDTEEYRTRREEALKRLATKTADRVIKTKRSVTLEPMPAHERKLIHRYLHKNEQVETNSEGKEPHRYLVVELSERKDFSDSF